MLKRLFVVVLFMVLSVTVLPEVAKADAYEYENINELVDSIASVINKKSTYTFKYTFDNSSLIADLAVTVNWKNKTVTFDGFIFREETVYKKEKFSAVFNLKSKKVKTVSKAYKNGNNSLIYVINVWDSKHTESLGHYLLYIVSVMGKDTIISKSGDKVVINKIEEAYGLTYYSTVMINKSKVLTIEVHSGGNEIKIEME